MKFLKFFLISSFFLAFLSLSVFILLRVQEKEREAAFVGFKAQYEFREQKAQGVGREKVANLLSVNKEALALQTAYNEVAKLVMPSVVSIHVTTRRAVRNQRFPGPGFFGNEDFFREFFGFPNQRPEREQRKFEEASAFGSGFVITEDGYLLSNHHVVADATKIMIIFKDEKEEYEADLIGSDKDSDVALLKIRGKKKFPFVRLGNSEEVQIGNLVVAIGNPFGLSHTFTTGVISALGRSGVGINKYENFIQTDVAINFGNSGGPLLNLKGEVIGINSSILSKNGGGNIGIGFAIPINMAERVANDLRRDGRVTRGWIGIYFNEIDQALAEAMGIPKQGVAISQVIKASPAEKAGLKAGDILVEYNKKEIKDGSMLVNEVGKMKIGAKVPVVYLRDGKRRSTVIEITKQRDLEAPAAAAPSTQPTQPGELKAIEKRYGVVVEQMSSALVRQYGERRPFGVVVKTLLPNSPFYNKGIQKGDLIEKVNRRRVPSPQRFWQEMDRIEAGKKIFFQVRRENSVYFLVITF